MRRGVLVFLALLMISYAFKSCRTLSTNQTALKIEILKPEEGKVYPGRVPVKIRILPSEHSEDLSSVKLFDNTRLVAEYKSYDINDTVKFYPGYHRLVVEAIDVLGNSTEKVVTFTVRNSPPVCQLPYLVSANQNRRSARIKVSAVDPDGDPVRIQVYWGDGDSSEWSYFIWSGEYVELSHTWAKAGTYYVKARAKDPYDSISTWSDSLMIVFAGKVRPSLTCRTSGQN